MGKIFCLMGKSSTGKDTIFKEVMKNNKFNLKKIVPYTTRPIREGEMDGVNYYFTDEEGFNKLEKEGRIIEARAYETFHGLWRYFTVDDNQIDLENNNYIIIGTLVAYEQFKEYFGAEKLVPIMIELDDGERLQRALHRERKPENHRYEEMCRRYLADCVDFSQDKLDKAGIKKKFYNEDLDQCVREVLDYMRDNC